MHYRQIKIILMLLFIVLLIPMYGNELDYRDILKEAAQDLENVDQQKEKEDKKETVSDLESVSEKGKETVEKTEKENAAVEKKVDVEKKGKVKEVSAGNDSGKKYVSVSAKVDVTVPKGKVDTTYALHLEVKYILPWWNPHISFGVDAGFYPLSGEGINLDSQIGTYDYSWNIYSLPIYIGPSVEYPTIKNFLYVSAHGGFAMSFAWSESKQFGGKNETSDIALGYYAGAGAEIRLGMFGGVFVEGRYTGVLLDFELPEFNDKPGDLGGFSALVGYRYLF